MPTCDPILRVSSRHHASTLVASLSGLLRQQLLLDCTLLCDGRVIKAHRVVLAASSGYFRTAFASLPSSSCQAAAVILSDIAFPDLKTVVDFIYEGEVSIEVSRLSSLMRCSQVLQIKSLTDRLTTLVAQSVVSVAADPRPASLQNLHYVTGSRCTPGQPGWHDAQLHESPIICQALVGVRTDASGLMSVAQSPANRQSFTSTRSPTQQEDHYTSSEEIEIPEKKKAASTMREPVIHEDETLHQAPVDLTSNSRCRQERRSHAKPRDFFANGILSRSGAKASQPGTQAVEPLASSDLAKMLSGHCSSPVASPAATEALDRSDSFSSVETVKRGRGRPPRHSLDDELRSIGEKRDNQQVTPSHLMQDMLAYKRLKLDDLGLPTAVRGRKPKLAYTSSRDVSGKNRCPWCPQVYYSTQAMSDHVSNVHSKNATKYGCKFCAKEFSWKISLNKHLRKQHPQEASKGQASGSDT